MAVKIDAGPDMKRGDFYMVDPTRVTMKEELRGRHKAPDDQAIIEMAESIMDHGQRQPVECRKTADNKLQLVLGFTRTAAVRLIRAGFTDGEGNFRQDPDCKLKVTLTDANDEQAFLNNVVENAHRNQTTVIDDAYNHHRLRDKNGFNDADITRLYKYKDPNRVGRLRRLLSAPNWVQDLIHEGKMPMQAALEILDIKDEAKQAEAFDSLRQQHANGEKIVAAEIATQVRESILRDDNRTDEEIAAADGRGNGNKTKPRTIKEIRKFFEGLKEKHPDENVQAFCDATLLWVAGKRQDQYMKKAIDKLIDAERS